MAKGNFFSKLKKKLTIKNVIKGVAGLAAGVPIVGGAIQAAAEKLAEGKKQAQDAAAAAQQESANRLSQAAGGSAPPEPPAFAGGAGKLDVKNPLLWIGAAAVIAVLFVFSKRKG